MSDLTLPDLKLRIDPMVRSDPSSLWRLEGLSLLADNESLPTAPNSSRPAASFSRGVAGDKGKVFSISFGLRDVSYLETGGDSRS